MLGLEPFESDEDVIENAADQRMMHVRTFQSGPNSKASQDLLNELAAAKICLLDREKRAAYDRRLREAAEPETPADAPARPAKRVEPKSTLPALKPLSAPAVGSRRHRTWMPAAIACSALVAIGLVAIAVATRNGDRNASAHKPPGDDASERERAVVPAHLGAPPRDAGQYYRQVSQIRFERIAPGKIGRVSDAFRPIVVLGDQDSEAVLIGLCRAGEGNAVLASHPALHFHPEVLEQTLDWLRVEDGSTLWFAAPSGHLRRYANAIAVCQRREIDVRRLEGDWSNADIRRGDLLFHDHRTPLSNDEIVLLQRRVQRGSHLLASMLGWVAVSYDGMSADELGEHPMNRLVRPYGAAFLPSPFAWPEGEAAVYSEAGQRVGSIPLGK